MGGGVSKFEETDWKKADGGLIPASLSLPLSSPNGVIKNDNGKGDLAADATETELENETETVNVSGSASGSGTNDETIDGAPPTESFKIYELRKKTVNQREFDVIDPKTKELLYTTRPVPGTLAWFDILTPVHVNTKPKKGGKKKKKNSETTTNSPAPPVLELKLRVQTDLRRRTWTIYRYHKPFFEGQRPATLSVRKGLPEINNNSKNKNDDNNDNDDNTVKLYKAACVTVSWSRYVAVAARYGPPSLDDILDIDQAAAYEEQEIPKTSFLEKTNTKMSSILKRDLGSIINAESLFFKSKGAGTAVDDNTDFDIDVGVGASTTPAAAAALEAIGTSQRRLNVNSTSSPQKSYNHNSSRGFFNEADDENDDLDDDEDESDDEDVNDMMKQAARIAAARRPIATPTKEQVRQVLSSCSPICNTGAIKNDSPEASLRNPSSFDSLSDFNKQQQQQQQQQQKQLMLLKRSMSSGGESSNGILPLAAANNIRDIFRTTSKRFGSTIFRTNGSNNDLTMMDDGMSVSTMTKAERRAMRRKKALEAAMEGIIDLGQGEDYRPLDIFTNTTNATTLDDKDNDATKNTNGTSTSTTTPIAPRRPIILCQEIYNKIIGTHQTSLVTRDEVMELLEVEKSLGGRFPTNVNKNNNNSINSDNTSDRDNEEENNKDDEKAQKSSWFGFSLLPKSLSLGGASNATSPIIVAPGDQQQQGIPSLLDDDDDDEDEEGDEEEEDSEGSNEEETDQNNGNNDKKKQEKEGPQPLIGYWTWKNTYTVHKMKMHLARHSDLAMHVALAILVNQVRYERNAIAMTV